VRNPAFVAALLAMMVVGFTAGCAADAPADTEDLDALSDEIERMEEEKTRLMEQAEAQEETIADLAEAAWDYRLAVDERCIPLDGEMHVPKGDFDVVVSERLPLHYDRYTQTLNQGRLQDPAEQVTLLSEDKLYKETAGAGTVVDVPIAFLFRDLGAGSEVEMRISEALQRRLQLETRDIRIIVGE